MLLALMALKCSVNVCAAQHCAHSATNEIRSIIRIPEACYVLHVRAPYIAPSTFRFLLYGTYVQAVFLPFPLPLLLSSGATADGVRQGAQGRLCRGSVQPRQEPRQLPGSRTRPLSMSV